ncbi:tetratricopeptide repeat protein, partial [bacterium]|nr:tetratricopeptide repeat protein [bacterium]
MKTNWTLQGIVIFFLYTLLGTLCFALPEPEGFPTGWRLNPSGTTAYTKEFKIIENPTDAYKGKRYAYIKGHLVTNNLIYVAEDDQLIISFYAKDPERKDVSVQIYAYELNKQGRLTAPAQLTVVTKKTGTEWTKIEGNITIPKKVANKRINAVKVALISRTGAFVDYAHITHIQTPEWKNYQDASLNAGRQEAEGDFSNALKAYTEAVKLANTEEEKKEATLKANEVEKRLKRSMGKTFIEDIFGRADVFLQKGNYTEARKEYEKIKELKEVDYSIPLALFNIAESYRLQKDYANTHKTFNQIFTTPGLTKYYHIYGLFREAEVYIEQKNYNKARQLYQQIISKEGALEHHILKARLYTGDTYRARRQYRKATDIYTTLLREQETSDFPNESFRV